MTITIATDCSGIDAPIVALNRITSNVDQVFCSDVYKPARAILKANKSESCVIFNDIQRRSLAELSAWKNIDIYVFSPPCQNYSGLSWNKSKEDPHLWKLCVDVVDYLRPKTFVFENVERFTSFQKGEHFQAMLSRLHEMSCYEVHYSMLNSKDCGVPQNRKRLFLVGIRKDCIKRKFEWPAKVTCTTRCVDLLDTNIDSKKYKAYPSHESRLSRLEFAKDVEGILNLNSVGLHASWYHKKGLKMPHPARNDICPTMPFTPPGLYCNHEERVLTGIECLRLMGFRKGELLLPAYLKETNLKRLCGNSIVVSCIEQVFRSILWTLAIDELL